MKLIELARTMLGRIVTNDFNLNKVAQLRGVEVLNINELANALKPVVLPGEVDERLHREGRQGIQPGRRLPGRRHDGGRRQRAQPDRTQPRHRRDERAADDRRPDDLRPARRDARRRIRSGARFVQGRRALREGRHRPTAASRRSSVKLPPFHWWRTVFFLIPAVSLYTIGCGVVSMASTLVDRRGHFAHRCAQLWSRLILGTTGVVVHRRGVALPAEDASCIFVANHASFYDMPIIFTALPQQLRIMAKAPLGYVPFIGWHLALAGHLLVDRARPGAAIFKRMQRMTRQNASLIVFPEGSRTLDGHVGTFKGGIFLLAIETGLPIVPVSVVGSRAVMPKNRLMVCPAEVDVVVHDAIPTKGLTRHDARALAAEVERVVASAVDAGVRPS